MAFPATIRLHNKIEGDTFWVWKNAISPAFQSLSCCQSLCIPVCLSVSVSQKQICTLHTQRLRFLGQCTQMQPVPQNVDTKSHRDTARIELSYRCSSMQSLLYGRHLSNSNTFHTTMSKLHVGNIQLHAIDLSDILEIDENINPTSLPSWVENTCLDLQWRPWTSHDNAEIGTILAHPHFEMFACVPRDIAWLCNSVARSDINWEQSQIHYIYLCVGSRTLFFRVIRSCVQKYIAFSIHHCRYACWCAFADRNYSPLCDAMRSNSSLRWSSWIRGTSVLCSSDFTQ